MRKRFRRWEYLGILKRQELICACGCDERLNSNEGYQFDHALPLHLGGEDALDNLRAVRDPCHKKKTKAESKGRAKVRRIKLSKGLTGKKPNKKDKFLQKMKQRERMP